MQGQLCSRCPKLKRVALSAAAMAKAATKRHGHRERVATARGALVQRTTFVPLHAGPIRGLELKQVQHLLHHDLSTKSVEVDAWHGSSSPGDPAAQQSSTVPFPSLYGERERLPRMIG